MSNPQTSAEAVHKLQDIAMRLHCALTYAPIDGYKLPASITEINASLGMALQACDAASLREIPV